MGGRDGEKHERKEKCWSCGRANKKGNGYGSVWKSKNVGRWKSRDERRVGKNHVREDSGLCILQSRAGGIQGGDRKEQSSEDRERTGNLAKGGCRGTLDSVETEI